MRWIVPVVAFGLVLVAEPAWACRGREGHCKRDGREGGLSLWIGGAKLDADALDRRMVRAGWEPREERSLFWGVEGRKIFPSDLVLGLVYSGTRGQEMRGPNGNDARLSSHQLAGELGFALVNGDRWLIYPAFLLGGYRLTLDIDASRSDDFDAILASPGRGAELRQSGAFVGGVLAVDRRFYSRRESRRFVSVGLRLGVMQGVSARGFRLGDDSRATDSPETLPLTRFAALAIGFGRRR